MWFKKKKVIKVEPVSPEVLAGSIALAAEYYNHLSEETKIRLPLIIKEITGKDCIGKTVADALQELTFNQLLLLQKTIENDYKFTKH